MLHLDTIFLNGRFRTLDRERPGARAVAVSRGVIAAVGEDEEVRQLAGPGTEIVDLGGRAVVPGLVDAHCHLVSYGMIRRREADLRGVRSIREIQERLRRHRVEMRISEDGSG